MRLASLLGLPPALIALIAPVFAAGNSYSEHLHLQPLPPSNLYAGFSFKSTTPLESYTASHFRYFPRSLAQILQYTHTAELHLRFALGRWDEESWGSRPRGGLREGGNGVELWAWVEDGDGGKAEERWSDLVNSLSGLFCASLNFIDSGKTTQPVLLFEPEGDLDVLQGGMRNSTTTTPGDLRLLHGMLPHEVVCTENLTPFLKLLPCKGKVGVSSLLDGHKVFDANWQTMAVDVRPVCASSGECEVEIEQTVDMVLDIERSMRPRESPIPRPPPIEDLICDENKSYNAHDTCYPKSLDGDMAWSISSIFGRAIRGSCPLSEAGQDDFDVTLEVDSSRPAEVVAEAPVPQSSDGIASTTRKYKLPEGKDFDLNLLAHRASEDGSRALAEPPLYASRQITGYGAERGGMHTLLRNPHPYAQRIVYLESLPWFLRPYMHTLQISAVNDTTPEDLTSPKLLEKMYYTPLLDRQRGTHLELLLHIPAHSTVEITYDFEKAILRYTEYPPDANRGFDIPAAVIRVLPDVAKGETGQGQFLRTTSLLLPLPTPDFSMPYNVIILTSTVVALGFGSIFNLLTRRFVLVDEVPVGKMGVLVSRFREYIKGLKAGRTVEVKGKTGVADMNGNPSNGKIKVDKGGKKDS